MHTYGGIEVRIGGGHDSGHGSPSRHPHHVNPVGIDVMHAHDLMRDPGYERRLAGITLLVDRFEPVPTLRAISRLRLLRIDNKKFIPFCKTIHASAGSKISGRLGTAMQHHHEGQGLSCIGFGDKELVGACPSRIGKCSINKLPSRPNRRGRRLRCDLVLML